ncbi:WxL domain-containing protein [Enterococcus hulanensis]|uniref:WxL domain-containing protein n=1 Tax=Enterococcus hulanensis TaxID=2559929 RepID=UPI001A8E1781|nr:WxL domain-containing protein [Enterococcus hulanensis]MBO0459786.1 WxL domain-containing protein [Enterococcus hulanensis]
MKHVSKILLSTVVLGAIAAAPLTTFAAEGENGGVYNSNGAIEFTPNTDPTNPVDPTDPTDPVQPIDPTDPEGPETGTNGPLSIDFASSLDFGKQKITSEDKVYLASAQPYQKLGEDGKPTGDILYGPDYVQVTDNRGTEAGWSLTVAQEKQFTGTADHELTGAAITLKGANVQTASESTKPTPNDSDLTLVPGEVSPVMSAQAGQGAGTYLNDWGTKDDLSVVQEDGKDVTKTSNIQLAVPGATTKYAEKYSTKLVWTLTDVPGNSDPEGNA